MLIAKLATWLYVLSYIPECVSRLTAICLRQEYNPGGCSNISSLSVLSLSNLSPNYMKYVYKIHIMIHTIIQFAFPKYQKL